MTVVFVTHDIDEAVRLGDRVAVFATGGRLAQFDTPARLLGRPADDFVAEFVGSTSGLRRLDRDPARPGPHRAARRRQRRRPRRGRSTSTSSLGDALAVLLREDRGDGRRQAGRAVRRRAHSQRRAPRAAAPWRDAPRDSPDATLGP